MAGVRAIGGGRKIGGGVPDDLHLLLADNDYISWAADATNRVFVPKKAVQVRGVRLWPCLDKGTRQRGGILLERTDVGHGLTYPDHRC